jgi:hypothetical protein
MSQHTDVGARRLWLPWRPRFRLIMSYPRHWHWVMVRLNRFDLWYTRRIEGRRFRRLWIALIFPVYLAVRFLGLVAVLELAIIALAASLYLLYGEWLALVLLFPFVLLTRVAHLLPWRLTAQNGTRRWTTRISGWSASRDALTVARDALAAGREPPATRWIETQRRSRLWM